MAGHTDNSVVIDKPIDEVWQRMNDLENWTSLFTEYASVEILEREGNTVKFRLTTHPGSRVRRSGLELDVRADHGPG